MDSPFTAAIAAAAAANPMASGSVPVLPNSVLNVDGDGLAYYCAGKDGSSPGDARAVLVAKIDSARRIIGLDRDQVRVFLTASGSNKGHRYAIARRKPYQGQRANSRRPTNWRTLREFMEGPNLPFPSEVTSTAEADDLFARDAGGASFLYTQDKDMRQLIGPHLDWVTHRLHHQGPEDAEFSGKQYGLKWFWLQMLHGDTADNIPGLPLARMKYGGGPIDTGLNLNKCGEAGALKVLGSKAGEPYHVIVAEAYQSYYEDRWLVEMMEQACLLWLQRMPGDWEDCMNPGGPLAVFNDGEDVFAKAYFEIKERVANANSINTAAQDGRDSNDAG